MSYLGTQSEKLVKVLISNLRGQVPTVKDLSKIHSPRNADLYIVQENRHGYLYDEKNETWIDLGEIKGEKGDKGDQGEMGAVISIEPVKVSNEPGSISTYRIVATNGDNGIKTLEFQVYNGKDGVVAINDNNFSKQTVWSSYHTRKVILESMNRIPSYVASMLF